MTSKAPDVYARKDDVLFLKFLWNVAMTRSAEHERFFLPENYRPNPIATTRDTERPDLYWNLKRRRAAGIYQFPVYRYCMEIIHKKGVKSLTDIGCGFGTKLALINNRFPEIEIVGIDQESAIAECQKRFDFGNWYSDDLECPKVDFHRIKADLVVCSDVIEHVTDPDAVLRYLIRSVKSDGMIVISTPDRESMYRTAMVSPRNPDHVREWSYGEFAEYLRSRGFYIHEHFHVPPIKLGFDRVSAQELVAYLLYGRKFSFNQVCLVRASPESEKILAYG